MAEIKMKKMLSLYHIGNNSNSIKKNLVAKKEKKSNEQNDTENKQNDITNNITNDIIKNTNNFSKKTNIITKNINNVSSKNTNIISKNINNVSKNTNAIVRNTNNITNTLNQNRIKKLNASVNLNDILNFEFWNVKGNFDGKKLTLVLEMQNTPPSIENNNITDFVEQ